MTGSMKRFPLTAEDEAPAFGVGLTGGQRRAAAPENTGDGRDWRMRAVLGRRVLIQGFRHCRSAVTVYPAPHSHILH